MAQVLVVLLLHWVHLGDGNRISIEIFGALQVIQMPLNFDHYHNGNGRVNAPELLGIVDVWDHSVHRQAASSFAARLMTTFYNRRVVLSKTWQLSPLL